MGVAPPLPSFESSGQPLTWTSRVWIVRSFDGKQTPEPVSLSQIARAFRDGVLPPDVEVARVGEWLWENIRTLLARHAALAPPASSMRDSDGLPELELTLTVQRDAPQPMIPRPPAPPTLSGRMAATVPPEPRTMRRGALADFSLDLPLPARLALIVYATSIVVAAATLLGAVGLAVASVVDRLGESRDAGNVTVALLAGLAWLVAGVIASGTIVVFGRTAAGIVVVARRIEGSLDDRRGE